MVINDNVHLQPLQVLPGRSLCNFVLKRTASVFIHFLLDANFCSEIFSPLIKDTAYRVLKPRLFCLSSLRSFFQYVSWHLCFDEWARHCLVLFYAFNDSCHYNSESQTFFRDIVAALSRFTNLVRFVDVNWAWFNIRDVFSRAMYAPKWGLTWFTTLP